MVQQYGGDGRELLLCFPGEFLGMGHFIAIDDKAQHNAAINGRLTQIKMPQQAFPCLFIVDGKPMGIGIMTHPCGDLAENHRLQGTVPAGNDSMAARRKKSGIASSIALPKGKLSLIAVACVAGGGQNRQRLYCKAADAPHGILYPALLFPQLRFVGDVPQATTAAALIAGAVNRNTIRGRGDDLFDDAIAVAFLHLYDSHSQFISGGGHWHKDRDAISVPDAAALIGDGFYGKWDDVILLKHGVLLFGGRFFFYYTIPQPAWEPPGAKRLSIRQLLCYNIRVVTAERGDHGADLFAEC